MQSLIDVVKAIILNIPNESILCTWCIEFEVFYHYSKPSQQLIYMLLSNFIQPINKNITNPGMNFQSTSLRK